MLLSNFVSVVVVVDSFVDLVLEFSPICFFTLLLLLCVSFVFLAEVTEVFVSTSLLVDAFSPLALAVLFLLSTSLDSTTEDFFPFAVLILVDDLAVVSSPLLAGLPFTCFFSSFFDSDFLVFSLLVVGFFLVVPKSSSQSSDLRLAAAEIDCDDVGVEFEYLKGGNRRTSGSELLPFSPPSLL